MNSIPTPIETIHGDTMQNGIPTPENSIMPASLECGERKMTNGDRLRQMTDEELTAFLDTITDCCNAFVPKCDECPMKYRDTTPRCNIGLWLKQEVQDNDEC